MIFIYCVGDGRGFHSGDGERSCLRGNGGDRFHSGECDLERSRRRGKGGDKFQTGDGDRCLRDCLRDCLGVTSGFEKMTLPIV